MKEEKMKLFWLLILTTFVAFNANSLKAEQKLVSESFEISELVNDVEGDYLDHEYADGSYLKVSWIITNISQSTVTFKATLEKISMGATHTIVYCIGEECSFRKEPLMPPTWISSDITFAAGASSNPDMDSYLGMYSGNDSSDAIPMIDTFRVTYRNVNNEDDYVTFLCTWDFKMTSIRIIEDISDRIFPNPTQSHLNLFLGENNINEIEIFDVNGNQLLSHSVRNLSEVSVDISAFNAGVYIGYFVKSGKRVKVFKFVKQA